MPTTPARSGLAHDLATQTLFGSFAAFAAMAEVIGVVGSVIAISKTLIGAVEGVRSLYQAEAELEKLQV